MELGTLADQDPSRGDSPSREISRAMVAVFKEYVGRGPTVAKTYIHDDLVVCVLHDTMTRAEQTLAAQGKAEEVQQLRRSFQPLFREHASREIERIIGRPVIAFLSDHAVDPDWAVEAFVLQPPQHSDEPADDSVARSDGSLGG
jgi:uncharacterized protein YbcI